jgi:transposase
VKKSPERAWLTEVSAVVLQQALADLNAAYRNFFASIKGTRKGPKIEKPRFRSRKDHRQAYKARLYGREFCRIGRFTPTSQTCSLCGVRDGPKPLHVREWQCASCGAWLDRDVNAAVNVAKAAGLAVTACGAVVRSGASLPADRAEAGTHPKSHQEAA